MVVQLGGGTLGVVSTVPALNSDGIGVFDGQ
jgi:hypothetical protein